jgi:hypothetical protein
VWSWFEFRCWLKYLGDKSAVVRERRARAAEEAIPEEQRVIGGRGDALPIDQLEAAIGWR